MKKLLYIIIIISALFSSCTDFLERAPVESVNAEKVFSDYSFFRQYADYNYNYVVGHYSHVFNAMQAGMSDEAQNLKIEACTRVINTGAWDGSVPEPVDQLGMIRLETIDPWADSYTGIRTVNLILENMHKVPNFPSQEIKNRYQGEMHFLRAMLYFQLIKRYGGVPIVKQSLTLGEDNIDLPRNTYDECVKFIVEDCDAAAGLLGLKYDDADNGRATIGAAKALKSRVLLYAARPLNNPENDATKWEAARDAAMDVIKLNQYSLYPDYVNMFFEPVCDEIILNRPRPRMDFNNGGYYFNETLTKHFFVRFIAPEGYRGWMGTVPSQNLVDMFEDSDGFPIQQSNIYNNQDPYANRDPRLKMTILYDGRYWYNRETEFYKEVDDNGNATKFVGRDIGYTEINSSAYAIAKLWPEGFQRDNNTMTYLNYIFFRYAEILLNFAEAQNEIAGPESSYEGWSVRSALNAIRHRVGHVDVPTSISGTTEEMRERIWNERAVELCFEDHRWYDVLTWKKGTTYFNKPIMGMDILKYPDGHKEYKRINLSERIGINRVFEEHMHRYPIPYVEIYKTNNLEQNPGW